MAVNVNFGNAYKTFEFGNEAIQAVSLLEMCKLLVCFSFLIGVGKGFFEDIFKFSPIGLSDSTYLPAAWLLSFSSWSAFQESMVSPSIKVSAVMTWLYGLLMDSFFLLSLL